MDFESAKLIFLGTGTSQGVPVIGSMHPVCLSTDKKDKRFRTSALLKFKNTDILLDCGPDFRIQMLNNHLSNVDVLLLTHEHNDHVAGMDDLRPINFLKKKDIPVYGLPRVLEDVKMRFPYAFSEVKYPGVPSFELHEVTGNFTFNGIEIIPINIWHGKLPIIGYRIGKLAYITDAFSIDETEFEKLEGIEILVVNALRIEPHYSHFNLEQALDFIQKIKPKKAYLTHLSHLMGFHEEVQKTLPKNVFIAYDGLEIEF